MDWFLYDNGLRHERVKAIQAILQFLPHYHFIMFSQDESQNLF